MAGIESEPLYKLVVIGGGPAGIGVFVRAARLGLLPRLLDPAVSGKPEDVARCTALGKTMRGIAVLHDGDASTFGSGNLGEYIINSNTFANSLTASVLDEKPDLDPPESIKGTFLERVSQHPSAQRLTKVGAAPACLVDIGLFLRHIGECVLAEVEALPTGASTCLLNTTATRIDVLESGIIRVEARAKNSDETVVLLTEHIALATGGFQEPPVLDPPSLNSKVFMSDECVREKGFARLRDFLLQQQSLPGGDKKVCIVGGSHSSFSVAWLLLHKFRKTSSSLSLTSDAELSSKKTATDTELSTPPAELPTDTSSEDGDSPLLILPPVPSPTKSESVRKPSTTGAAATAAALMFKPKDITLLHRSAIRSFYFSRKEAEADGADGSRVDRSGCVNTFTGLREDAKALFKEVRSGKETRVRLFQLNKQPTPGSQSLAAKAYADASAIVWGCGYKTRMVPIFDASGKAVRFVQDNGVLKLDNKGRLQLARSSASGSLKSVATTEPKAPSPPESTSASDPAPTEASAPAPVSEPASQGPSVSEFVESTASASVPPPPASPAPLTSPPPTTPLTPPTLSDVVGRMLGLGLGFHLRSAVDEMGGETRADGVTVYHRRGASLVLEALFGREVYGSSSSFEEMVEKVRGQH